MRKRKKLKYKGGLKRSKQRAELITFTPSSTKSSPNSEEEKRATTNKFIPGAIQLKNLFKSNIYFSANDNAKCHNFSSAMKATERWKKGWFSLRLKKSERPREGNEIKFRPKLIEMTRLLSSRCILSFYFPAPSFQQIKIPSRRRQKKKTIWIHDHNMFIHVSDCNSFVLFISFKHHRRKWKLFISHPFFPFFISFFSLSTFLFCYVFLYVFFVIIKLNQKTL